MSDQITFKLSRPLKTHQGELRELTFKEPTARLYIMFDIPFKIHEKEDDDGKPVRQIEFIPARCFKYISELTGHDELILGSIHSSDVMPLFYFLAGLLGSPPKLGNAAS